MKGERERAEADAVNVAAAVITRADGSFLLAERPGGKVYAGYWEFPGGKIEPGETPAQGLARELHEELGIDIEAAYPWLTRMFTYAHATVRLHFHRVTRWRGEPHGREQQRIAWQRPNEAPLQPMLPANTPIFHALRLPAFYAISNAGELGEEAYLKRLQAALENGVRLVQLREKEMAAPAVLRLAHQVVQRCHDHGAKVLINNNAALAVRVGADGVHLPAQRLLELQERPPGAGLVGASCHNAEELSKAIALNVDFAVLGPILPTASHPNAAPLGWGALRLLLQQCPLPVYALGGLSPKDLTTAWQHGAHGIAMQRAIW